MTANHFLNGEFSLVVMKPTFPKQYRDLLLHFFSLTVVWCTTHANTFETVLQFLYGKLINAH